MAATERAATVGLDTSVVLRLMTGEPAKQAEQALAYLSALNDRGGKAIVSDIVVAEAYVALQAHYGVPKREAVAGLLDLLKSDLVSPAPDGCAMLSLEHMTTSGQKPGFVDRLIHAQYRRRCAALVSFETASRKLENAVVLT